MNDASSAIPGIPDDSVSRDDEGLLACINTLRGLS